MVDGGGGGGGGNCSGEARFLGLRWEGHTLGSGCFGSGNGGSDGDDGGWDSVGESDKFLASGRR